MSAVVVYLVLREYIQELLAAVPVVRIEAELGHLQVEFLLRHVVPLPVHDEVLELVELGLLRLAARRILPVAEIPHLEPVVGLGLGQLGGHALGEVVRSVFLLNKGPYLASQLLDGLFLVQGQLACKGSVDLRDYLVGLLGRLACLAVCLYLV